MDEWHCGLFYMHVLSTGGGLQSGLSPACKTQMLTNTWKKEQSLSVLMSLSRHHGSEH